MDIPQTPFDSGLESLLSPGSLALIGATEREGSVGRAIMENILRGGFRGCLYPVNPRQPSVLGTKAYPSILDIPGEVDAAVVAVPAERVEGVIGECARKGTRGVVVVSSGFKECGPAGRALEASLERTARSLQLALMGPNCLGLINTDPRISLNATFANRAPCPGSLSFLSQSGALGVYALEFAAAHGIGLRLFASIGNKAVLHENHLLRYFGADPLTKVILAYLEDFQAPEEFFNLAADIASGSDPKPVVLLKSGTGTVARRAVASHTGALVEKADFLDDLCAQYGVIRAGNLEDMFNHALCLSRQPLPRGPRVGIVTNAGGPAILAADEAERLGLVLPEPGASLREAIARIRTSSTATGNPIDLLGDADSGSYVRALSALLDSGEADALPRSMLVNSRQGLRKAALDLGFPLVAKLESPDILHKVDVGGMITGIGDFHVLEHSYTTLLSRAGAVKPGGAQVNGILLQEMVQDGVEFMIGAHRNPHYGILTAFGLGGTLVEAIWDVAFRRAPLSLEDVDGLIHQIHARAILERFRGRPPRDVPALRDCLLRLSWLMADFPMLSEVDLNPGFSLEFGAVVADARMVLWEVDGSPEGGSRHPA